MADTKTVVNRVKCSNCGTALIVECATSVNGTRIRPEGGFFQVDCSECTHPNPGRQLAGDRIEDVYPDLIA